MSEATTSTTTRAPHASSASFKPKANLYESEYLGSGTFKIVKPKRKAQKRRQSALKGATRGARK